MKTLKTMETINLMEALETLGKDMSSVSVTLSGKINDYLKEVVSKLSENTKENFKDIMISYELSAYAQLLLINQVIQESKNTIIKSAMEQYNESESLTFEEKTIMAQVVRNIVNVATYDIRRKVASDSKIMEKNILEHLTKNDFVIGGTDFTSKKNELMLKLDNCKGSFMAEFNDLVLKMYTPRLSKRAIKKAKDEFLFRVKETIVRNCLTTEQVRNVTTDDKIEYVSRKYAKVNLEKLTENYEKCNGVTYIEINEEKAIVIAKAVRVHNEEEGKQEQSK